MPALHELLDRAGLRTTAWLEPARYDPAHLLPDPKLRARAAALDPVARMALAEALAGNMSTHVVYCVRAAEWVPPPDGTAPDAIPVARELPCAEMAANIAPDGTLAFIVGRATHPAANAALGGRDPEAMWMGCGR